MAHGGKEIRLGLFTCQGAVPCRHKLGFGFDAVRDVAQEGDKDFTFFGLGRLDGEFHREDLVIRALGIQLDTALADHMLFTTGAHSLHTGFVCCTVMIGYDQLTQIRTDGILGRMAKDLLGRCVEI